MNNVELTQVFMDGRLTSRFGTIYLCRRNTSIAYPRTCELRTKSFFLLQWLRKESFGLRQSFLNQRFVDSMIVDVEEPCVLGCFTHMLCNGFSSFQTTIDVTKIDLWDLVFAWWPSRSSGDTAELGSIWSEELDGGVSPSSSLGHFGHDVWLLRFCCGTRERVCVCRKV